MLRERSYNFARHYEMQSYVFRQSGSDTLAFWHKLIFEAASYLMCINISHWHYLLLKELHLFDYLDKITDLFECATFRCGKIDQAFNCLFKAFLTVEHILHLISQYVSGHHIDPEVNLN